MQLNTNTLLQSGKYRIVRVLGQGGFGITYLAENVILCKKVAIKELFPKEFCGRDNGTSHLITFGTQHSQDMMPKLKARFLKEAVNIAKLDHPGIIKVHDVFEENNTVYYVMDYIEGESLSEKVKRTGPLSESKAIEYIRKIGDALDYIHSRQMTHYDIKPANIMVRSIDDAPVLIDFGLSKQYDNSGSATSSVLHAESRGFSPLEVNTNEAASFSPQTDIYSLGATLYYLLTGAVPPEASEVLNDGLEIPSTISAPVRAAIEAAMEPRKKNRPAHSSDFCNMLCVNAILNISNPKLSVQEDTRIITPETDGTNLDDNVQNVKVEIDENSSDSYSAANGDDKNDSRTSILHWVIRILAIIASIVAIIGGLLEYNF